MSKRPCHGLSTSQTGESLAFKLPQLMLLLYHLPAYPVCLPGTDWKMQNM